MVSAIFFYVSVNVVNVVNFVMFYVNGNYVISS